MGPCSWIDPQIVGFLFFIFTFLASIILSLKSILKNKITKLYFSIADWLKGKKIEKNLIYFKFVEV